MNGNNVDNTSIGLCIGSIFLKVWSDVTLSDFATLCASIAAITTIAYNIQRMVKESKQEK